MVQLSIRCPMPSNGLKLGKNPALPGPQEIKHLTLHHKIMGEGKVNFESNPFAPKQSLKYCYLNPYFIFSASLFVSPVEICPKLFSLFSKL